MTGIRQVLKAKPLDAFQHPTIGRPGIENAAAIMDVLRTTQELHFDQDGAMNHMPPRRNLDHV